MSKKKLETLKESGGTDVHLEEMKKKIGKRVPEKGFRANLRTF